MLIIEIHEIHVT